MKQGMLKPTIQRWMFYVLFKILHLIRAVEFRGDKEHLS